MKNLIKTLILFTFLNLSSCIENDIPYPRLEGAIEDIELKGQIGDAQIDYQERILTVQLDESVYIKEVELLNIELTQEATLTTALDDILDLSMPLTLVIETYPGQFYEWTLTATQEIERYFIVEDEADLAAISVSEKKVTFYLASGVSREDVKVLSYKLGQEGSTITPDPTKISDYSREQTFELDYRGEKQSWTVVAENLKSLQEVTTLPADAYAKRAILFGQVSLNTTEFGFKYKKVSDKEWIIVSSENIKIDGKNFNVQISDLEPLTEYTYTAYSAEVEGQELNFTTEEIVNVPNLGFDNWIKKDKNWYPNLNLEDAYFWDSGNPGANTLSEVNPTSPEDTDLALSGDGKRAARLESKTVFGKFAGGSVFTGKFDKLVVFNALLDWGRPFTGRPTSLKGYYKYSPKTINKADEPYTDKLGTMDQAHIFIALMDWEAPYTVNTGEANFVDFQNDPDVIAYAEFIGSEEVLDYQEFQIDLEYRDTRKPKYIMIVAASSRYADYFTGGVGSLLLVDEFELIY